MADDLSAPLGRKRGKPAAPAAFKLPAGGKLPLARIGIGALTVIGLGLLARILLVNDPMGGRPVADISVNSPRNANALQTSIAPAAPASMATISVGPEMPASGPFVSMVGADVPDGS